MTSRSKQVVRVGVTGGLAIAACVVVGYPFLARLFPAARTHFQALFLATAGMCFSTGAMALRVMWLTHGTPDQPRTLAVARVLPEGGATVLGLGWLTLALPIIWPYGRVASIVAMIVGIVVIGACHVWSTTWTSRRIHKLGYRGSEGNKFHDAV